jgi:phage pi2 protein 07
MTQADSVHSTPRKTAFKIVAGTDVQSSGLDSLQREQAPQGRKRRGPYKHQREREYQHGLPVIDPAGQEDEIFRHIAEHRAAATHYDRCVDVANEAEGKVSADEFSHLQRTTSNAWDEMMLFARCVILHRPTTRRGLIHQVRYLVSQFNDLEGCQGGCMYFPDEIGERPWAMAFLQSLAAGLRKMAGELDSPSEGARP